MDPPLDEYSFGNIHSVAMVILSSDERYSLVGEVRDAIGKINMDYVKKLQEGNEHLDLTKEFGSKIMKEDIVPLYFTSLCRFPIYEVDFGWGNPIWVGRVSLPYKNVVVFIDRKSGG
jgi:shikimate O-hydroxycinnamoyltransferase